MPHLPHDLDTLADFAAVLAQRGGEIAQQWFRADYTIDVKKDSSPVTIADRTVEAEMRESILHSYPHHGILGEEHGQEAVDAEYVWVIDPIDGTRSFITGSPLWGTLVALLYKGRPVVGAVEIPVLKERWLATAEQGCHASSPQKGAVESRVSGCSELASAQFYTTSIRYFDEQDKPMINLLANTTANALFGGDCYIYGLLASGYIDLVVESQLKPYDYLALIPIIEEAGGVITDWEGRPLSLQSDGNLIAASTHELHAQTLQFIRNHR